jgi:ABC-type branched-subunit amino acid transport system substrate-binding protein
MTSAQNPQLPLSGNRYIWLFSAAFLLLQACSSKQATTLTPIVEKPVVKQDLRDTVAVVVPKREVEQPKEVVKEPETPVIKPIRTSFNIAVVLPFSIHQVPLDFNPYFLDTNVFLSEDMKQSLDFYMGMKLAVDDHANTVLKTNFFILDDANNSATVRKLLQSRPFPEVDFIIGAKQNYVAKELISFAKENQVPVISPFLIEVGDQMGNPFFYSAAPSLKSELTMLLERAHNRFPEKDLHVLYDSQNDSSRMALQIVRSLCAEKYRVNVIATAFNEEFTAEKLTSLVEEGAQMFMVASFKESIVKDFLQKSAAITAPLTILGMSNWMNMRQPDWNANKQHSISITGSGRTQSAKVRKEFDERFIQEFNVEPNETTFLGYDLTNYILKLIEINAIGKFPSSDDLELKMLMYGFRFEPVVAPDGSILQYKNAHAQYLRWQQNQFSRD